MINEAQINEDSSISYTAYKLYIRDIRRGKLLETPQNRIYLQTKNDLRAFRVRILGTIMFHQIFEKDEEAGRREAAYITVDDGTEQIRIKTWDELQVSKIKKMKKGQVIDVIGTIREYNDEMYLKPLLILPIYDLNFELLRDLDILTYEKRLGQKSRLISSQARTPRVEQEKKEPVEEDSQTKNVEDENENINIIVELIRKLDQGEGVEISQIQENCSFPKKDIKKYIQYLYENGYIYEPSVDRYKIL
ncbi:MAG: OB-fold nucleic acid binding domain-containing protein [Candidatus Helarchaeales archaeon]